MTDRSTCAIYSIESTKEPTPSPTDSLATIDWCTAVLWGSAADGYVLDGWLTASFTYYLFGELVAGDADTVW